MYTQYYTNSWLNSIETLQTCARKYHQPTCRNITLKTRAPLQSNFINNPHVAMKHSFNFKV